MKPLKITLMIIVLMIINIGKAESVSKDSYLINTYETSNFEKNIEMEKIIKDQQKIIRYYQLYCLISLITFTLSGYIFYSYRHQKINKPVIIPKTKHSSVTAESETELEPIYDSIIQYVVDEKHFLDKEIDIESVGINCHIKKKHVNKVLDVKANSTLLELVNSHRLEYACILLLDKSNKTMDAIADESGFKTTRTFLRQFKSRYNMLPSEYRRNNMYNKTILMQ